MKNISLYVLITFSLLSCSSKNKIGQPLSNEELVDKSFVFLTNEIKPVKESPCFQGAYYRKAMSSKDSWIGIKGEVVLPKLNFDSDRMNPTKPKQFLDVSSIYLGGNMDGQETDIGLAWEIIRDEKGVVSQERMAFRPFLRRTDHKSGQKNVYINGPAVKEYYWYPGEKVIMSVEVINDGELLFRIEGAGKKYETIFECAGYTLNGIGDFKRVNAIDQMGNEGKAAQPTKTSVVDAKWNYTTLIRMEAGKRIEVPMHNGRFTSMVCPDSKFFNTKQSSEEQLIGAETISIIGNP